MQVRLNRRRATRVQQRRLSQKKTDRRRQVRPARGRRCWSNQHLCGGGRVKRRQELGTGSGNQARKRAVAVARATGRAPPLPPKPEPQPQPESGPLPPEICDIVRKLVAADRADLIIAVAEARMTPFQAAAIADRDKQRRPIPEEKAERIEPEPKNEAPPPRYDVKAMIA